MNRKMSSVMKIGLFLAALCAAVLLLACPNLAGEMYEFSLSDKTPITFADLRFITAPQDGETSPRPADTAAVAAVNNGEGAYTITGPEWAEEVGGFGFSGPFLAGSSYRAKVVLTPRNSDTHTFDRFTSSSVYHDGVGPAAVSRLSGGSVVVIIPFQASLPSPGGSGKTPVPFVDLRFITAPKVGESAPRLADISFVAAMNNGAGAYTLAGPEWAGWTGPFNFQGPFQAGADYRARVVLTPDAAHTFDGFTSSSVLHDGVGPAEVSRLSGGTVAITVTFQGTGPNPGGPNTPGEITAIDLTTDLTAPVVNGVPRPSFSASDGSFFGTVTWRVTGGANVVGLFRPEIAYEAEVILTAGAAYTFNHTTVTHSGAAPNGVILGSTSWPVNVFTVTVQFPPTTAVGGLTLKGMEAGKTYRAETFSSVAVIADYTAFRSATLDDNRTANGAGLGDAAAAGELAIPLTNRNGGSYTETGAYLLTVRVTTAAGEVEDIYYQPRTPFVNGNAEFNLAAAKSRNQNLLGGAVSFRTALERIYAGNTGPFSLTPEDETLDANFPAQTISTVGVIRINGNGKTVTLMRSVGTLLTIQTGADLTLGNLTLNIPNLSGTLPISVEGSLTLDAGAALRPGAIAVSGTLVMNAGSLVSAKTGIPGVRLGGGSFAMKGGEISGSANGVSITSGNFTLDGGVIKGNTSYGVSAGAGSFTMNSGEISGNAGGVTGSLTMTGGKISGNTAVSGGGVTGSLTMTGGEITGNTAVSGGGVFVTGTVTLTGGMITGNKATGTSGYSGVYFSNVNGVRPTDLDTIVTGNTGGQGQHNWPSP